MDEVRWETRTIRDSGGCGWIISATDEDVEQICILPHPCSKHPDAMKEDANGAAPSTDQPSPGDDT